MIVLDMSDKRPLYEQIVDRIKELIVLGVLEVDEKIPSVRQLAIDLSINPNTIQRAYTELERSGFVYSVKGRGNFVADISSVLPVRQNRFYDNLDNLLVQHESYSLSGEEIIDHVNEFFRNKLKEGETND